jgi:hypothetical protein
MQRCAAMVAASALFLVVALAVLEPAAGFTGPNALLPLRARSDLLACFRRILSHVDGLAIGGPIRGRIVRRAAPLGAQRPCPCASIACAHAGPLRLCPLMRLLVASSSQAAVPLRSTRQCTRMQMEEPKAVQTFKRRASSFLAGLYVTSALVTGTPAIVQPSYAAGAAVEESEQAAETAGKKAKAAAERAKAAKKQLEKDVKAAEAQAKAEEKAVSATLSNRTEFVCAGSAGNGGRPDGGWHRRVDRRSGYQDAKCGRIGDR